MELVRTEGEATLMEALTDDWWKPTILLYVGKIRKPSQFIRSIREAGNGDLAYLCMQETSKRLDDDLKDLEERKELEQEQAQVTAERYQQLETFLKNQQWREANDETWKLMLATAGREDAGWFRDEDIKDFDCKELLTIDKLWVHHSQGLYGFSVSNSHYGILTTVRRKI